MHKHAHRRGPGRRLRAVAPNEMEVWEVRFRTTALALRSNVNDRPAGIFSEIQVLKNGRSYVRKPAGSSSHLICGDTEGLSGTVTGLRSHGAMPRAAPHVRLSVPCWKKEGFPGAGDDRQAGGTLTQLLLFFF